MPEWTAEVIWWVCGTGVVALLLGWLVGRFAGGRVPRGEYDRLISQERSLRNELNDTKTRQASVDQELRDLRTQNLTLTGEVDANQRIAEEARVHAVALNDSAGLEHEAQISELDGINASLRDELEAARQRYAELHSAQTQLNADLEGASARLADLDHEKTESSAALDAVTNEIEELRVTNTGIATELDAASERVEEFEKRTASASDDLYLVRARVSEVEGKLAAALKALRDASTDLTGVQDGINATAAGVAVSDVFAVETPEPAEATGLAPINDQVFDLSSDAADIDLRSPDVDVTDVANAGVEAAAAAADAAAKR